MTLKLSGPSEISNFLNSIDTLLLDCDGVLWQGENLIAGVKETLDMLRTQGKQLLFVSNNSSKSRQGYVSKFKKLGLDWVQMENIVPSSYAAARYLSTHTDLPTSQKSVYVIGEEGLQEELELHGIKWCGGRADGHLPWQEPEDWTNVVQSSGDDVEVGAVLMGFDRYVNYRKLAKANYYIRYCGANFYATNDDATFPTATKHLYPGSGSLVAAVQTATGVEPKLFGKPHQFLLDTIVEAFGLDRMRTCMVGDRLNTDVLFGRRGGLKTVAVLTGVATKEEVQGASGEYQPDFYMDSFADLLSLHLQKQ